MSSIFYGVLGMLNMPWWGNVVYLLICLHLTNMAITIFLHRSQAHRSLDIHPCISHFCRFWLWHRTGIITKAWTAIHRKHHAKCETSEDPHSPQIFGIKTVLWKGAELYRREATNVETLERYGKGTPDDWLEQNLYAKHSALGIYLLFIVEIFLFGIPGIAITAIQMAWSPLGAAGVINGIGHYWGYRNFECPDAARNIVPIGFLLGGEELHNNHHTYPTSAKFSIKAWEFDIAWGYISVLKFFGLATIKRTAPKVQLIPGKMVIDVDTLRDLINNRFQVMTRYTQEVILPLYKTLRAGQSSSSMLTTIKTTLIRNPVLVKGPDQARLLAVLEKNPRLYQLVQLREKLYQIWNKTTANQKELIEALQNWCQEAETLRIKSLNEFSAYLKSYALNTV